MGLSGVKYDPKWEESGYQTIIRHNWYLLNYEQLMTLLGYTEEKLDFLLKEEDFLYVKLGNEKPEREKVAYAPLTEEQIRETEKIAKKVQKY